MALQPCRAGLARSRNIARALMPCARAYSTEMAPESFKTETTPANSSSVNAAPRWTHTPAAMKAPLQLDFAKDRQNKVWAVNNDPRKLDAMYERLLGPGGSRLLPEEVKWLAVTHKSFDQGRRGYNDKLAMTGRLTLVMEMTKNIVAKDPLEGSRVPDEFGREAFEHPKLQSVDNLNVETPMHLMGKRKISALASKVGLSDVVRWKPRLPRDLKKSGVEVVLNGALFAIVGAITLQHGSAVATQIIQERIFSQLPGQ